MNKLRTSFQAYHNFLHAHPAPVQSVQAGILMAVGDVTCQLFVENRTLKNVDKMRVLKFGSIGLFFIGPVLTKWYKLLDKTMKSPYVPLKKVVCDQLLVAPVLLALVTSGVSLLDNKTINETKQKLQESYFDILLTNYQVWPLVQAVNFAVVPLNYQLLVVQTVAIFWNIYLSYKTHQELHKK